MTTIHRTTTGSKNKMQCQTITFRIQTYSKRILLNTPRIQDSRFKVPGQSSPWHLESWILDPRRIQQNTFWIRLNTPYLRPRREFCTKRWGRNIRSTGTPPIPLTHAVLQLRFRRKAWKQGHPKNPCLPKAEIEKTGVGTWGGYHIYIYIYIYIYLHMYI